MTVYCKTDFGKSLAADNIKAAKEIAEKYNMGKITSVSMYPPKSPNDKSTSKTHQATIRPPKPRHNSHHNSSSKASQSPSSSPSSPPPPSPTYHNHLSTTEIRGGKFALWCEMSQKAKVTGDLNACALAKFDNPRLTIVYIESGIPQRISKAEQAYISKLLGFK